jgi:hypothetical protein
MILREYSLDNTYLTFIYKCTTVTTCFRLYSPAENGICTVKIGISDHLSTDLAIRLHKSGVQSVTGIHHCRKLLWQCEYPILADKAGVQKVSHSLTIGLAMSPPRSWLAMTTAKRRQRATKT